MAILYFREILNLELAGKFGLQIARKEIDVAMFSYLCTYARSKIVHCPPAVLYVKYSWYTRYPKEKSKG